MVATKCSPIRRLMLVFALIANVAGLGNQALCADEEQTVVQVNLANFGGVLNKFTPRTNHATVMLSDETVWAVFPTQGKEGLLSREPSQSPGYSFLHMSSSGQRISQCTWHMPANAAVEDFFPRVGGGFVIRTASSLISLSSDCREQSTIPSPGAAVESTSDGKTLVLEVDKGLQILDAESLREVERIPLPAGLQHYHRAYVWDRLIVIRDSAASPCYWTYRTSSSSEQISTWHSMPCPQETMTVFGDDAILVSNWTLPAPNISLYSLNGSVVHRFEVGEYVRTDTSMFPLNSCVSLLSGRAGIYFYDRKRTLLGQEKITGEHVAIIDLLNGRTLLSLPVRESDPLLNCSLSQDGKKFALLRGLNLSLFNLPG